MSTPKTPGVQAPDDGYRDMRAHVFGIEWEFIAPRENWKNHLKEEIRLTAADEIDAMGNDEVVLVTDEARSP
jgi:hypothetical protein